MQAQDDNIPATPDRYTAKDSRIKILLRASAVFVALNVTLWFAIDLAEFCYLCRSGRVSIVSASKYARYEYSLKASSGSPIERSYRLLAPPSTPSGRKYPLLLFLHGSGQRGNDGVKQLHSFPDWMASNENRRKYPCFLLVPQCPERSYWIGRAAENSHVSETQIVAGMLRSILDDERIDSDRVYVVGYSMGAMGTWKLATEQPDMLAAIIPIAGRGQIEHAQKIRNLPIWAFHGERDQSVSVEGSRSMIEAIRHLGGNPLYTEYPGLGHGSLVPTLRDSQEALEWLFTQRRARAVDSAFLPSRHRQMAVRVAFRSAKEFQGVNVP